MKRMRQCVAALLAAAMVATPLLQPLTPVWAAEEEQATTTVDIQAEDAVLSPAGFVTNMAEGFIKESDTALGDGQQIRTSKIGATITLTFEGTGIEFYTKKGSGAGILAVEIDGEDVGQIDEYTSGNPLFKEKVFSKLDLSATNESHTITLTTVASTRNNFNFDFFKIHKVAEVAAEKTVSFTKTPFYSTIEVKKDGVLVNAELDGTYKLVDGDYIYTASAVGYITKNDIPFTVNADCTVAVELQSSLLPELSDSTYDVSYVEGENDSVVKTGTFNTVDGIESVGHAGTHIGSGSEDASVSYTFTGKGISVYTKGGKGAGVADIYMDDVLVARDDQYVNSTDLAELSNRRVYTAIFEEEGEHTIKVVRSGDKNPSATNTFFNFDCFKVFEEKGTTGGEEVTQDPEMTVFHEIPHSDLTATATSENPVSGNDGPASYAIDDSTATLWHTDYTTKVDRVPQSITLTYAEEKVVGKLNYLPRQDAGEGNGIITAYDIEVLMGDTYVKVASGTWAADNTEKTALIPFIKTTSVRLTATAAKNGFVTAANIDLFATDDATTGVNKSSLKERIAEAQEAVANERYTQESRAVLSAALEEAKQVSEKVDATQSEVNREKFRLSNAILGLEVALIVSPGNTIYYLDSEATENGDGKTETNAFDELEDINAMQFAAGDKILIKAGSSFVGQLYPKGSGSEGNPIIIDQYGEGEKPLIDGNGRYGNGPAVGANGPFGEAGAVVYLCNQQYWEINNLKVTNWDESEVSRERSGIRVEAVDGGVYKHIYVKNCDIYNIRGYVGQDDIWQEGSFYGARTTHRTGGINFCSYTNRDANKVITDTEETRFDDILIEGNTVDTASNGITTTNVKGILDTRANRHTNVVIRNNYIHNVQRAGIVPLYTNGVLVEYNKIDTFQQTTAGYGCGIWCDRANDMVFQYNEVCNGQNTMDGMAFNLDDMTENGLIQYNYTHNNVGGGYMLHIRTGSYNRNNTIRYNLSVNDTYNYNAHQAVIVTVGEGGSTLIESGKVYNNTIINTRTIMPVYGGNEIAFTNNIFYLTSAGMAGKSNAYSTVGANTTFKNNVFAGIHAKDEPTENGNISVYDPKLSGVLTGTQDLETALLKAKLGTDSPALKAGLLISENGGKDIYDNTVSQTEVPNIGAYNGEAVEITEKPDPGTDPDPGENPEPTDCDIIYVEGESDAVVRTGTFRNNISDAHAGAHISSDEDGAKLSYTFTGKAISVYTKSGVAAGVMNIKLDGKDVAVDDQFEGSESFNRRVYTVVFEEEGEHTIVCERTGNKNPSSTGANMNFDCFKVFKTKTIVVDKTALNAKIAVADKKVEADYTAESWAVFATALQEAKTIAAKEAATEKEVTEALTKLTTAMSNLVEKPVVDKTALNAKIAVADKKVEADYTAESWAVFATALKEAKTIAAKEAVTEKEVTEALTKLTTAMSSLVEKPVVDKTALNAKIAEADKKVEADYTAESWAVFATALKEAKTIAAKEAATEKEVTEALTKLTTAMSSLVEKPVVDKTALNAKIAEADEKVETDYTAESWSQFATALQEARIIVAKVDASQAEVDEITIKLDKVINSLVKKPVYKKGWNHNDHGWWYQYADGTIAANKWEKIDNAWYHFKENGYMQTGWIKDAGSWYYLKASGKMATGWIKDANSWYYLKTSGKMATGWIKDANSWYYLKTSGKMATGWIKDVNSWYYLKASGKMATGWMKEGKTWYYLAANGKMLTNWQKVNGVWYYLKASGKMAKGWTMVNHKWYYLNANGAMRTGWLKLGKTCYYLSTSGKMVTGWNVINGKSYFFNSSGAWTGATK